MDIIIQQVGVGVLYPEKILDQSDKGIKQFTNAFVGPSDHQHSVSIRAIQVRWVWFKTLIVKSVPAKLILGHKTVFVAVILVLELQIIWLSSIIPKQVMLVQAIPQ